MIGYFDLGLAVAHDWLHVSYLFCAVNLTVERTTNTARAAIVRAASPACVEATGVIKTGFQYILHYSYRRQSPPLRPSPRRSPPRLSGGAWPPYDRGRGTAVEPNFPCGSYVA